MYTAARALTAAAFGCFPISQDARPAVLLNTGVDLLILLGVARDPTVSTLVHRVYLDALPAFIEFRDNSITQTCRSCA